MIKKTLLASIIFLSFAAPALAGGDYKSGKSGDSFKTVDTDVSQDNFNAVNESANEQRNSGTVNQTAVYNIGEAAKYRFGEYGVTCASPVGMLSGGRVRYDNEYTDQISFALVIPFGGRNGSNCKRAAEAITNQHVLSAEIQTAKACSELVGNGVTLSEDQYPYLFEKCKGVAFSPAPVTEVEVRETIPVPEAPVIIQEAPRELPPVEIERRTRG